VLDDVLSEVDTHVAQWLFENALTGELCMNRTRILATHNAEMCRPRTSYFVELKDGKVESAVLADTESVWSLDSTESSFEHRYEAFQGEMGSQKETRNPVNTGRGSIYGHFNWNNVMAYYRAGGGSLLWITAACVIILDRTVSLARTWWLKKWTANIGGSVDQNQNAYFIAIYMVIALSTAAMMGSSILFFFVIGLNASKNFYKRMLHSVLKAPIHWMDSTPPGQILGRFKSDMGVIDQKIIIELSFIVEEAIHLIFIITTWSVIIPFGNTP
jgi:hypothetical protein